MSPRDVVRRLIIGALGLPLMAAASEAQPISRVPTVGVLNAGPADSPAQESARKAFEAGLAELGWRPGETVRIDYRYAGGQVQRLNELARELARLKVDVIVARGILPIRAAMQATASTPVVMSASGADPVQLGFVKSPATQRD